MQSLEHRLHCFLPVEVTTSHSSCRSRSRSKSGSKLAVSRKYKHKLTITDSDTTNSINSINRNLLPSLSLLQQLLLLVDIIAIMMFAYGVVCNITCRVRFSATSTGTHRYMNHIVTPVSSFYIHSASSIKSRARARTRTITRTTSTNSVSVLSFSKHKHTLASTTLLHLSNNEHNSLSQQSIEIDSEGRLIRRKGRANTQNSYNQNNNNSNSNENNNNGEWDTFNPMASSVSTTSNKNERQEQGQGQGQEQQPRRYGRGGWVDDTDGWDIHTNDNDSNSNTNTNNNYGNSNRNNNKSSTQSWTRKDDTDITSSNGRFQPTNNNHNNNRRSINSTGRNHQRSDTRWENHRTGSGNRSRRTAAGGTGADNYKKTYTNNNSNNNNKNYSDNNDTTSNTNRINIRDIENAGYDHLYGLSSIVNALQANVRFQYKNNSNQRRDSQMNDNDQNELNNEDFSNANSSDDWYNYDDQSQTDSTPTSATNNIKPEAQVGTFLFVQDTYYNDGSSTATSRRSNDKQQIVQQVMSLVQQYQIPIIYVNKGILNTLSSNRPHQGYVLRCPKINTNTQMTLLSKIPTNTDDPNYKSFWLVLDEVVDPQNFGAILRSAYFLGGGHTNGKTMGILICSKNSAPPSAVVSATSAGALELFMIPSSSSSSSSSESPNQSNRLFSTNHLIRVLTNAEQEGCRIIGASSSVPTDHDVPLYNLQDIPPVIHHQHSQQEQQQSQNIDERVTQTSSPGVTILVLGSEGHGLRPLVSISCTEFVRIPPALSSISSTDSVAATSDDNHRAINNNVDSLNVSVTAGILLWHLLRPPASTMTSVLK